MGNTAGTPNTVPRPAGTTYAPWASKGFTYNKRSVENENQNIAANPLQSAIQHDTGKNDAAEPPITIAFQESARVSQPLTDDLKLPTNPEQTIVNDLKSVNDNTQKGNVETVSEIDRKGNQGGTSFAAKLSNAFKPVAGAAYAGAGLAKDYLKMVPMQQMGANFTERYNRLADDQKAQVYTLQNRIASIKDKQSKGFPITKQDNDNLQVWQGQLQTLLTQNGL